MIDEACVCICNHAERHVPADEDLHKEFFQLFQLIALNLQFIPAEQFDHGLQILMKQNDGILLYQFVFQEFLCMNQMICNANPWSLRGWKFWRRLRDSMKLNSYHAMR